MPDTMRGSRLSDGSKTRTAIAFNAVRRQTKFDSPRRRFDDVPRQIIKYHIFLTIVRYDAIYPMEICRDPN